MSKIYKGMIDELVKEVGVTNVIISAGVGIGTGALTFTAVLLYLIKNNKEME